MFDLDQFSAADEFLDNNCITDMHGPLLGKFVPEDMAVNHIPSEGVSHRKDIDRDRTRCMSPDRPGATTHVD